ncbi:MAG: hypothetical protein HZA61_11250 [Candidatus Eisenbacteria bacterium]|uniref:T9SS type A sorting domain-containing protein n=1 Tax=Eiseniibacteriota bacterium TaxID=2212470 RepID=A0A933SCK4_UNCEI|nr:hypothetical protein [Candidatus Eisenbacteria bacterium]
MRPSNAWRSGFALLIALLAGPATSGRAEVFHDDFSLGLRPEHWLVVRSSDAPRYVVGDIEGELRFRKGVDTSHVGRQWVRALLRHSLLGGFSVEVQYHGASLARLQPPVGAIGPAGNSVRLSVTLPDQLVEAVRSDEQNAIPSGRHAWLEPPGFAYGRSPAASNAGVLRIERSGFFVSVWADGQLLTQAFLPPDTVRSVAIELRNDATTDSTGVNFDDFVIVADEIVPGAAVASVAPPMGAGTLHPSPNPFTREVSVAFAPGSRCRARVEVLDTQGRRVALLGEGEFEPGRRVLTWRPGPSEAPGLYLAVATFGGRRVVRRLAFVR